MRWGLLFSRKYSETPPVYVALWASVQFLLDNRIRSVHLTGIEDIPADGPCDEIRDLEAGNVGGLGHEAWLALQRNACVIAAIADSPELELKLSILPGAAPWNAKSPASFRISRSCRTTWS